MGRDRDNEEGESQRIDLGFDSLIKELSEEECEEERTTKSSTGSFNLANSSLKSVVLELANLADEKQWEKLEETADKLSLDDMADEPAVTFYWAYSQFTLGKVPLSILSAPIETSTKKIEQALSRGESQYDPMKQHISYLLLSSGLQLSKDPNDIHSVNFLARAGRIDPKAVNRARDALNSLLREVETKKMSKKDKTSKIEEIKGALASLKEEEFIPGPDTNLEVKENIQTSLAGKNTPKRGRFFLLTSLLAAIFCLIILSRKESSVGSFYKEAKSFFYSLFPHKKAKSIIPLISPTEIARLDIPQSLRIRSLTTVDAVLYDVQDKKPPKRPEALRNESKDKEDNLGEKISNPSPTPPSHAKSPKKAAHRKEQINTETPLEGTVFYPELAKIQRRKRRTEDTAYPSGDTFYGQAQESVREGDSPRSGTIYRVIADTRVMAQPSFLAYTLAELSLGARVEVVGRFGEWLKIRSKSGRYGYILSQDAEPVR